MRFFHWVTEGVADYIRWFLYEPEKQGARVTRRNIDKIRHDASYRVSVNFIDYVVRHHDDKLLVKLNHAARTGNYDHGLWKTWTGKDLAELEKAWIAHHRKRLGGKG